MRRPLALVLLICVTGCAADAAEPCLPLQGRGTQGGALLPGGLMGVRYGGSSRAPLALDVYPHADGSVRPLAMVLRGGRGTVGQRSSYVGQLVELFAEAGYVVSTPDYRATEAAAADLTGALRLLTSCHARALRLDPQKVVIVAEDTGAVPALSMSARLLDRRPGRPGGAPASPVAVVLVGARLDGAPAPAQATFVVHGTGDTDVPVADARALCATASAPCTLIEVDGASHRAENWWPAHWGYKSRLLHALAPIVGDTPRAAWRASARLRKKVTFDAAHGLTLDIHVPGGPGPHPAVMLVHGGGWEAGDRVTYVAPMFALAASRGVAWISIDYRLTPAVTNREQMADVVTALDFVRAEARSLGVDPTRLVLLGESASGQMVTHVAARRRDVAGVISFYGVYDLEAMAGDPASPRSLARRLFGITEMSPAARDELRAFSPVHHASRDLPPMLLIAGTADRLITQQRAYAAALSAAGARHDVVEVEGAPHGMEAWADDPAWGVWEAEVSRWLESRFRRAAP